MNITAQDILLNNDKFNYLVRHYKIIKRNNYDSTVVKKVLVDETTGRVICDDITGEAISTYKYNDYLSQDYDDYENRYIIDCIRLDNAYDDLSLIEYCENHNKFTLKGKHYNNILDTKSDISNFEYESKERFINEINDSNFATSEKISLKDCLYNYINGNSNKLYIRMAPDKSEKDSLLERIIYLQKTNPEYYINNNGEKIYSDDGIPVYNDNIIYSILKYETITEKTVKEILESADNNLNKKIEEL